MTKTFVKVSPQYRVSIPKQTRTQLGIERGDRLLVDVQDGMLILLPIHAGSALSFVGVHHEIWKKSDEYIERERNSWTDHRKLL